MDVKKALITVVLLAMVSFSVTAISQQYHLLIIAPDEFVDELQPLARWKDETGRPTIILSYGEVLEKDYGEVRDEPEKMKKCIDEYVKNHNVQYVLLAGDCDKLPVRYIKAHNTQWGDKYYPSDLYYMDFYNSTGNFDDWDGDGDNIIGEMYISGDPDINKVNLDDINMYPDVAVARVPASTEAEITTYVDKVIDYESAASSTRFNNALLIVDDDWGTGTRMDAIIPYLSVLP